ncbi:MAG: S8/S53 family peptidase [Allosphingosinicella sp.]
MANPGGRGRAFGSLAVIALLSALSPAALAQQTTGADPANAATTSQDSSPPTVLVRAKRMLKPYEVATIARDALPRRYLQAELPGLETLTGAQAVESICGSLQEGYWWFVRRDNPGLNLQLDQVLGDNAYRIAWPACLFVTAERDGEPLTYTASSTERLADVSRFFTGAAESSMLRDLVAQAGRTQLRPGEAVTVPAATLPRTLRPRSGDVATFARTVTDFADVLSDDGTINAIVMPAETMSGGEIQSHGDADCLQGRAPSYPFNAEAVVKAYRLSRDHVLGSDGTIDNVHVLVVDNGFFGVPCGTGADRCPEVGDDGKIKDSATFPKVYFDAQLFPEVYGPDITYPPVNYLSGLTLADVNLTSGHGTHVAGLVLGGPEFEPFRREAFHRNSGEPWLKLVIVNVSNGSAMVPRNSLTFGSAVHDYPAQKIVNLSLSIDNAQAPTSVANLRRWASDEPQSLFVAAAGNTRPEGRDLVALSLYPAELSTQLGNVITVGALDASGALASFSNYGEAVDIAANGCKIRSWLRDGAPPEAASGTSQAAPIVTFGAALLRSLWHREARRLKERLVYSGDSITQADSAAKVRYGVQLSIPKALLFYDDILTYRAADPANPTGPKTPRTVFGHLDAAIPGLRCGGSSISPPIRLLSFKRPEGRPADVFFRPAATDLMRHCERATLADTISNSRNVISFTVTHEFRGGVPIPKAERLDDIDTADIVDLVQREDY